MSNYWIKLYIEILDDPKMATLPDRLWRRAIELFLLAGRENNGGLLPPINQMAWTLRLTEDELRQDVDTLIQTGIITADETANTVTNYHKRQSPIPPTERWQQHRNRKRTDEYNANVTQTKLKRNANETFDRYRIDTESDTESDAELINNPTQRFLQVFPGLSFENGDQVARFNRLVDTHKIERVLEVAAWLKQRDPPKSMGHALSAITTAITTWKAKKNGKVVVSREKFRADVKKYGLEA